MAWRPFRVWRPASRRGAISRSSRGDAPAVPGPAWTIEGRFVAGELVPPADAEPDPGRFDETAPDADAGEFGAAVFAFPPAARVAFEWTPRRPSEGARAAQCGRAATPSSRRCSTGSGKACRRCGRPAFGWRSRSKERSSGSREAEAMHATVVDATGSPRDAVGSWPVTVPVTSPRPAFRATFELDLAPLLPTTRFAVDAAATVFEAAFQQVELDAPAASLRDLAGDQRRRV